MSKNSWIVIAIAVCGTLTIAAVPLVQAPGAGTQQKQPQDPAKSDHVKKAAPHPFQIIKGLGLTDAQMVEVKGILSAYHERVVAWKQQNAGADKAAASGAANQMESEALAALLKVLTPDQRDRYEHEVAAMKQKQAADAAAKKPGAPKDGVKRPGAPTDAAKKPGAPKDVAKKPGAPTDAAKKPGAPKDGVKKPGAGPFPILGELDLSEEQAAKAKAIVGVAMQKVHDLKASNPNVEKATLMPQIEAIKLEAMKAIRAILTPEQQARFDKAAGGTKKRDKQIAGPNVR